MPYVKTCSAVSVASMWREGNDGGQEKRRTLSAPPSPTVFWPSSANFIPQDATLPHFFCGLWESVFGVTF